MLRVPGACGCVGRPLLHVLLKGRARGLVQLVVLVRPAEWHDWRGVASHERLPVRADEAPHVVGHDVDNQAHVQPAQAPREPLQVPRRAPVRVDPEEVLRKVPRVVHGVDGRGDPYAVKPHPLDVGQLPDDALEGTAAPAAHAVGVQVAVGAVFSTHRPPATPREAVRHQEVDALARKREPAPPLERGRGRCEASALGLDSSLGRGVEELVRLQGRRSRKLAGIVDCDDVVQNTCMGHLRPQLLGQVPHPLCGARAAVLQGQKRCFVVPAGGAGGAA
mmetsp:Transcript_66430/g.210030  ORF Transcript_66430/g.210030 Transcript_66430/m.210030 type:complete len:277 (-) Transcript_66430:116-946(-)